MIKNNSGESKNQNQEKICPYFVNYYRECGADLNNGEKGKEMIMMYCIAERYLECGMYKKKIAQGDENQTKN